MANKTREGRKTLELYEIDSDYTASGLLCLSSIMLIPGAANDVVVFKEGTDAGPEFCRLLSSDGEPRIEYFDKLTVKPVLDYSASTLSTNSKVIVLLG